MAAVIMSNPGLHMAVLGNPKTRRNKRKKPSAAKRRRRVAHKKKASTSNSRSSTMAKTRRNKARRNKTRRNMGYAKKTTRRNKTRRNRARRNPTLAKTTKNYFGGLTGAPAKAMQLFQGKNALRNGLYTAGGAIGAYWLGGFASTYIRPVLANIPGLGSPMGQRIVGSLMPYTGAFVASMLIKDKQLKSSLRLGGALASIVEFIAPGKVGELIRRLPGGATIAPVTSPVEGLYGLGAYVDAPSYAGTGEYVDAPSYAGTGEDVMLAGYVEDAGYRGAGEEMLAGNFLEESSMFQPAI